MLEIAENVLKTIAFKLIENKLTLRKLIGKNIEVTEEFQN